MISYVNLSSITPPEPRFDKRGSKMHSSDEMEWKMYVENNKSIKKCENKWSIFEKEKRSGDYYELWNDWINGCMNNEGNCGNMEMWKEWIKYVTLIKEINR